MPTAEKRPVFGIFSGGGVKGAAFLGAIKEAENHVRFVGMGGTSAGAMVAALLACGYTADELTGLLRTAPYAEFFSVSKWRLAFFGHYRGLVNPKPLLEWLRKAIGDKFPNTSRVTFAQIKDEQRLKIVATNVSTQDIMVFSKQTTPNMEIAQAVLASCSFPFLFPAFQHGHEEVVDGGVLSNFPMWLFDEDREVRTDFTPVLGFALVSKAKPTGDRSVRNYVFSLFDSLLIAQDRIQEKYMDAARLANVIRIGTGNSPTFAKTRSQEEHDSLILAGRDAASKYFLTATMRYGEPVSVPAIAILSMTAKRKSAVDGNYHAAVSAITRDHIFHGGVARDDGLYADRVFVRYYVDLMEAVADHDKLEVLAEILCALIAKLGSVDRIVGIKKGNVILAYTVARLLGKPLSLFKTDMSYKMGPPFDGPIRANDNVIIVDDVASDASFLLSAVRHLNLQHAHATFVVALIERIEGDARKKLLEKNTRFRAICRVDDAAIDALIHKNVPFSAADALG
jgi:NTE family protein